MRKAIGLALAAALGIGVGFTGAQLAGAPEDARATSEQQNQPPQFPPGFQLKDVGDLNDIRGEFGNVTNKAVTKDNFGSLLAELATPDRDRMKDYKDQDFKTLDGVIEQFRNDWKSKYGHDFDIKDAGQVYGDQFTIVQGVVTDPAMAVANWPVPATADQARLASGRQGRTGDPDAEKLEKGREVAIARIPASHGMPAITASLIHEKPDHWRFSVPRDVNSQQIHTQLQNHLTYLDQHKSEWPADENDAYREVTHHVVASLYNVNMPQGRE